MPQATIAKAVNKEAMVCIAILHVILILAAVAASTPTCPNTEPTCHDATPRAECRLWFDGTFVYSGVQKLRKGDPIGEADIVIPWHNHDRWAWTTWHRYSQFYEGIEQDSHVFAPRYAFPLECHKTLANLEATNPINTSQSGAGDNYARNQSLPLSANRALLRGDPVFINCQDPDLSSTIQLQDFPELSPDYLNSECTCIDTLAPGPSNIPNAGMGAFSRFAVPKGRVVAFASALHMFRSELHNKTSNQHELLINYALGHVQTNLLFLPVGAGVNYINHASHGLQPNVKLAWSLRPDDTIDDYFHTVASHVMFSRTERPNFFVQYEALKDIQAGDEILLNYGHAWQEAWDNYMQTCGPSDPALACSDKPFRHEIGVPEGFFPQDWLNREVSQAPRYSWDVPPLKSGEIRQMTVKETGEHPMSYGHRVGLPAGLQAKMKDYAERTGIMDILKKYVLEDQPLEIEGQERHRINGATWWAKRFGAEWESNMHYITPDDERSNTDFLSALGEAGFDEVLRGMGDFFALDGLVCYYASFIAVSHCTGSYPHTDAEETNGKGFNLIFPVLQANETTPELLLGEDYFGPLVIPYRYEPQAALVLGDDGVHHTAPTDYRRTKEMRLVISVYMGDINEENKWNIHWDESMDPPFPRFHNRMEYLMSNAGRDWKAGTDHKLPQRDSSFV